MIDDYQLLPQARNSQEVPSRVSGYVRATDCMQFGIALATLGGGREKIEHNVDHGVGLAFHKRIGDRVTAGESLVTIYYNSDAKLVEASARIERSFVFGETPVLPRKLIRRVIGA